MIPITVSYFLNQQGTAGSAAPAKRSGAVSQAAPWPGPISAITLFVEDLAAARAFYSEVFQLPVVFADEAHSAQTGTSGRAALGRDQAR